MVHLQMKMKITKCYSGTLILWYSFDSDVDVAICAMLTGK